MDYLEINRQSWNERARLHVNSDFYDPAAFKAGKSSLNPIELQLLPPLSGKKVLHLQCHFGQDTLSIARKGAEVTGVDLSDVAIEKANALRDELDLQATFICSDVYELPRHLHQTFDVVFTSYGTIGWLPDIAKWASVVSHFLKPGGSFVFVEFHPVVWMYDNDFKEVAYRYFRSEPIVETETGSYASPDAKVALQSVTWNHGLAEVIQSLLKADLALIDFQEYDYSPYNCFKNTIQVSEGKFQLSSFGNKIPMVYSLVMRKMA